MEFPKGNLYCKFFHTMQILYYKKNAKVEEVSGDTLY